MGIVRIEAAVDEQPRDIPSPRFTISSVFSTLVRVTDDQGAQGLGYAYTWDAHSARALVELLEGMTPYVLGGEPGRTRAVLDHLERNYVNFLGTSGLLAVAVSALDMALWDCHARALGQPIQALAGAVTDRVPVYISADLWPTLSPAELEVAAKGLVAQGFGRAKMWVASPDLGYERERVAAARGALGPDGALMVDAAQAYDVPTAVRFAGLLGDLDVWWFEDPVHYDDLAGLKTVGANSPVPLATGEHCYGLDNLKRLLDTGAISTLLVDLERIGGVTGFLSASALCQAYRVKLTTHCYTHTSARLLATSPATLVCEYAPLWDPLFGPPTFEGGDVVPSTAPGVSEDLVKEVAFRPLGEG
jgi:L-alanine-DL-glutamate epimerase-like enolase superfamily enzyme